MINIAFSYGDLEYFLLILVRVTCFIYISPFFGMSNTPNRLKIALGLFIAFLVWQLIPKTPVTYNTLTGYTMIIAKEAITGFLVGFGANLCMTIVAFAGRIIDMETGMMMASVMDPSTREQSSISGVFYNYAVMLILLITGMYQFLLNALVETFTLIPINGAVFRLDALLSSMLLFLYDYIIIGFRIALPIFVVITLLNAILGILAKVSPQMNMFAVGMQLKVLTGFSVIFVTIGMLPLAAAFIFDEMKRVVTVMVRVMML
ncbi:MAG: flagellar biosynthetic protein FliR [Lachnospiraceae bacterium]|nr:flagellar biosynthetic protein FliR [Lachnospiraceae bacterium]